MRTALVMRDPARFLKSLPGWFGEHIEPALAGNADAAERLIWAAPNADRGDIVKALWKHGVPTKALRAAVRAGWEHDHAEMGKTFGRSIGRVFRDAQFPVDHLPESFDIWRGGNGSFATVALGISWTRDRDQACWFAMRWNLKEPIVLRRTVHRKDVLAHITTRSEDEIVVWKVAPCKVDGEPSE